MESISFIPFGEVLKTYRKQRKLTQRQLADKLGVHYNTIWGWERGDYLPDSKGIVLELARHMNMNESETRSLLESSLTSLSSHWNVPYQRNPYFSGRATVLQQLHETLQPAQNINQPAAITLSGLGGIGKTQTAIEYAFRYCLDYSSIFWLRAETSEYILTDLIAIADVLTLSERQEQDQSKIVSTVHRWLINHHGWLLIIDNVQDIAMVKELLPAVRRGSLLFTTRLPTLGALAQTLHLEPLMKDEGVPFLLRRAGRLPLTGSAPAPVEAVVKDEYAAAEQLFTILDGLPLALDQAGAYIEKTQSSLTDFLHLFQQYPVRLLSERDSYDEHPSSVAKTFLLSFERLQRSNATAAEMLVLCCMLPIDGVPEELFTEASEYLGSQLAALGNDALLYNQTFQDLLSYSFVQRLPETKSIIIHRLVQFVIREQLTVEQQQQWATRLLQAANALFPHWKDTYIPEESMSVWPRCQRLLPLVFACKQLIDHAHMHLPEEVHLLTRAGYYLQLRAQYSQAEALYLQAKELSEEMHGNNHLDTAVVVSTLALLYYELGQHEEAQTHCQSALSVYELTLGAEHPATIMVANALGEIYRIHGQYARSEALFLRVLAFYEQYPTANEFDISVCLGNLALLYHNQKLMEKAEALYRRSIEIQERVLGPEHFHTATTFNNFARFCTEIGHYEEAHTFYQRALATYKQALGEEHPYIAILHVNMGRLHFVQQQYEQAEALYQQALALQKRLHPTNHFDFISTFAKLGQLYIALQRYAEAEENLQHALSIAKQVLAPEHVDIASILADLSRLHTLRGQL